MSTSYIALFFFFNIIKTSTFIKSICSSCAKCQIFGIPNTKNPLYQIFQILLFLPDVNSTLTNLSLYGQLWHKFLLFFIPLSLSSLRQSHPQTPILSSQTPLYLFVSHSLFLSALSPYSTSAPPCSPRRWHSPTLEIRSRGSSRSLSSSPAGSSRLGLGTELLTSSSLTQIWLSTLSSRRLGGPIGPRQRLCLGWCCWLLGWFVMGSGGMGVGFWFVGVGFGSWWCSGGVGSWLWLGIDQSKISLCLQTKTK